MSNPSANSEHLISSFTEQHSSNIEEITNEGTQQFIPNEPTHIKWYDNSNSVFLILPFFVSFYMVAYYMFGVMPEF